MAKTGDGSRMAGPARQPSRPAAPSQARRTSSTAAGDVARRGAHDTSVPSEPTSGRDLKKNKQRREMLRAAAKLFKRTGYQDTRIEDIAVEAGFSTKTVYNYFETKDKILVGLLREDRRSLKAVYETAVAAPGDDPAEALARLMTADIGDVRSSSEKVLWRELIAAELRTDHHAEDDFELNRREFTQYIARILRHFVGAGHLSERLNIETATDIIYSIHNLNFTRYCCFVEMTPEAFYESSREQIGFVLGRYATAGEGPVAPGPAAVRRRGAAKRAAARPIRHP